MRIVRVKVFPNSKREEIKEEDGYFVVHIKEKAEGGEANKALVAALSGYLGVKKSSVSIVKGHKSREKVVKIE